MSLLPRRLATAVGFLTLLGAAAPRTAAAQFFAPLFPSTGEGVCVGAGGACDVVDIYIHPQVIPFVGVNRVLLGFYGSGWTFAGVDWTESQSNPVGLDPATSSTFWSGFVYNGRSAIEVNGSTADDTTPFGYRVFFETFGTQAELNSGSTAYYAAYAPGFDMPTFAGPVGATTTPEPATVALVGGGLLALGAAARRRRRS